MTLAIFLKQVIISSKHHNMRITWYILFELILIYFFIMLMNIKLSVAHIEKNGVETQAKLDFPGGLRECHLHIYFPNILLHFSFAPSERRAPVFLHKCVLSKSTQCQ